MTNLKKLKALNGYLSENFYISVTGFDDENEYILGHKISSGMKFEEKEVRVKFDTRYNNIANRPTYQSLRKQGSLTCINIGDVYFVQGANLRSGVYLFKWGNCATKNINDIYIGRGPAIQFPIIAKNSKHSLRVSTLKIDMQEKCSSIDDISKSVENLIETTIQNRTIRVASFMLQVINNRECYCSTFSIGGMDFSKNQSLNKLNSNDLYRETLDLIHEDNMFKSCSVLFTPIGTHFFSNVNIPRNKNNAEFYRINNSGLSMWRDSIYLFKKVKSSSQNGRFWAIQNCIPSSAMVPYMPNACEYDNENIDTRMVLKAS